MNEGEETAKSLNFCQRLNVAVYVGCALEYLHHLCEAPIVHCDLKPSNILLDDEMVGHIGDFGLAKFITSDIQNSTSSLSSFLGLRGTIGYAPQEYGLGCNVTTYGDVYSYSILLLEMFTGRRPTDEMFKENLNLHNFVKIALPNRVAEITDPTFLQESFKGETVMNNTFNESSQKHNRLLRSLNSIFEIGISCSFELPTERMNQANVVAEFCSVRDKLLPTQSLRTRAADAVLITIIFDWELPGALYSVLQTIPPLERNREKKKRSSFPLAADQICKKVRFSQNQLSGPFPPSISNASNLIALQVDGNKFSGKISLFQKLEKLRKLNIGDNLLGSQGANDLNFLCSLTSATSLEIVVINDNSFGGILPECISNLSTPMTFFYMEGNNMVGRIPAGFGNLINLEGLVVGENQLSGSIPSVIGRFQKLKYFAVNINSISGSIPTSLGNLKMLIKLYLNDNNLQGETPPSLGKCENLIFFLDLSNNNLSGSIPSQIVGLSSLFIGLYLFSNRLTGVLPIEVGNSRNLGELDVSQNMLSSVIPNDLGNCMRFEVLLMRGYFFNGSIPSSLSSLREQAELNLEFPMNKYVIFIRRLINFCYVEIILNRPLIILGRKTRWWN
ncbi:putative receptor-like protein kinase At3g47110 [Durio zibethinus]|uniref:non-specific serine/threonine protein kinase n=1 Tax=Durio zibethinus TaxID=66656 RepID=A0A6P5Z5W5_DURZI|nr:putative receptor-like protein kinase At3g47110 [Durio zibethinus]